MVKGGGLMMSDWAGTQFYSLYNIRIHQHHTLPHPGDGADQFWESRRAFVGTCCTTQRGFVLAPCHDSSCHSNRFL